MKEIMIDRICYKGGKVTGQKMLEIHKLCDCYKCRTGYVPRKKRNQAVAYAAADDETAIRKAYDFLKEWSCKNPAKDLPTEYSISKEKIMGKPVKNIFVL